VTFESVADLPADPFGLHSHGGCACVGDGTFAYCLSLLLEALNESCDCEHRTSTGNSSRGKDGILVECRTYPLIRWWRATDRPWVSVHPRRAGGIESEIGAAGMAVLRRLLNGKAQHASSTVKVELSRLRRSILETQGTQCAACGVHEAKYVVIGPRRGVRVGAICRQCFLLGTFDVITLDRLLNGEVDDSIDAVAS
jgi:hypothetical protein